MNNQSIIVYNFDILFNILFEVKENLKFSLVKFNTENEILDLDENKYGNYLILMKILLNRPITCSTNVFVKKRNAVMNCYLSGLRQLVIIFLCLI